MNDFLLGMPHGLETYEGIGEQYTGNTDLADALKALQPRSSSSILFLNCGCYRRRCICDNESESDLSPGQKGFQQAFYGRGTD